MEDCSHHYFYITKDMFGLRGEIGKMEGSRVELAENRLILSKSTLCNNYIKTHLLHEPRTDERKVVIAIYSLT